MSKSLKKQLWWNNAQYRSLFFQVRLVAMVAGFFWFIGTNTLLVSALGVVFATDDHGVSQGSLT